MAAGSCGSYPSYRTGHVTFDGRGWVSSRCKKKKKNRQVGIKATNNNVLLNNYTKKQPGADFWIHCHALKAKRSDFLSLVRFSYSVIKSNELIDLKMHIYLYLCFFISQHRNS